MPFEIHVNGFPKTAPDKKDAAIRAGEREAQEYNHVEVWWVNSKTTGQKTGYKLIKRWKNGKEVS